MKHKVLIIEDQPSMRKLLEFFLGQSFQVVSTDNANSALKLLKDGFIPDIIVSDIVMPGIDGFDFLEYLKANSLTYIPVIILSSLGKSTERIKCLQLGACDYMVKPFNPEELKFLIENLIHKSISRAA